MHEVVDFLQAQSGRGGVDELAGQPVKKCAHALRRQQAQCFLTLRIGQDHERGPAMLGDRDRFAAFYNVGNAAKVVLNDREASVFMVGPVLGKTLLQPI